MKTLRECIAEAVQTKTAIGHFNISNLEGFWATVYAGKSLGVPVIIGVSEGERDFVGVAQVSALVKSTQAEGFQVYLNADHSYSVERVKIAIDAGFDAVIFDGAECSFDDNLKQAKECVAYARSSGRDVIVEGELGFIGKSSKILEGIPPGVKISEEFLTKPEDATRFVKETGVDLLAPAVGNIHGMLKDGIDPALNIERVKVIADASRAPLVLHGGSGNSADDVAKAISAGVSIVHINTELRVAYRKGLVQALAEFPDEIAPYKYLKPAREAMRKVVEEKLRIFNRK